MYCKVFASLYQGTLRGHSDEILVFTNLLAHSDKDGYVDKHFRAISEETGIDIERVKLAIINLESPDAESRSPEAEGARIVRLDEHRIWGWRIVNYVKYRALRNMDDRREQNRIAQEKWRRKQVSNSNENKPRSAEVSHCHAQSAHADADADADADKRESTFPSLGTAVAFFTSEFPEIPIKLSLSDLIQKKGKEHLTEAYCRKWLTNEERRNRPKTSLDPIQTEELDEPITPEQQAEYAAELARLKSQMNGSHYA